MAVPLHRALLCQVSVQFHRIQARQRQSGAQEGKCKEHSLTISPFISVSVSTWQGKRRFGKHLPLRVTVTRKRPSKLSASRAACTRQRAAMIVAAHNDWRQQGLRASDRQNPNRPSTQRGLTQLPPSRCLSALRSSAQFVLCCEGRGDVLVAGLHLPSFPHPG